MVYLVSHWPWDVLAGRFAVWAGDELSLWGRMCRATCALGLVLAGRRVSMSVCGLRGTC
jgi:hypothetical protein